MQVEVFPEWSLTPSDESGIADLLALCFSTGFGGRSFFKQRHSLRIVARDDAIVGHIAMTYRAIRVPPGLVDIFGLGDVATHPGRRGEGIASHLLRHALEIAQASPAKAVLLFGDAPLYAANGFHAVRNLITRLELAGARTGEVGRVPANGLMMVHEIGAFTWDESWPVDLMGHTF